MSRTAIPSRALPAVVGACVVVAVVAGSIASHGATAPKHAAHAKPSAASHATRAAGGAHTAAGKAATSKPAAKPATATKAPASASQWSSGFVVHPGVGSEPVPSGFPNAYTTGVPSGLRLHAYTGPLKITRPGTVISDVQVTGCLTVQASRVTIRDSKIVCHQGRAALALLGKADGSKVTDVEIDGAGVATVGIEAKNATLSQVNIHGTGDGVHLGRGATLEDSYIHDLDDRPAFHHDDLQTLSGSAARNVTVLHNTLQAYAGTRQDNTVYHLGSGSIASVLVEDNFMDGGHFTIEAANGPTQHDIVFRGNHFGLHFHYGILLLGQKGSAVSLFDNTYQGTGAPATEANSHGEGQMD